MKCLSCNSVKFKKYQYGNHTHKKIKESFKQRCAKIVSSLVINFFPEFTWFWIKVMFSPKYKIWCCLSCGHGEYELKISDNVLRAYYRNLYWHSKVKDSDLDLPSTTNVRAESQLDFILPFIGDGAFQVLEIGGADCQFSIEFREHRRNSSIDLSVVDPGERWENRYKKHGINKIADYFPLSSNDKQKPNIKFDLIHTSHWLEHVSNLELVISELDKILKNNGLLFIEVPNCNDDYWEMDIGDIPHLHFFTETSLKNIVGRTFDILDVGVYGPSNNEFSVHENFNLSVRNDNGSVIRVIARKRVIAS